MKKVPKVSTLRCRSQELRKGALAEDSKLTRMESRRGEEIFVFRAKRLQTLCLKGFKLFV